MAIHGAAVRGRSKALAVKFIVTLSALSTLLPSLDTRACQAPYPSIIARAVVPADGELDVALDARIIVRVNGRHLFGRDSLTVDNFANRAAIALTTVDGTPVDATLEPISIGTGLVVFITPTAPLAPHTEYVVWDRILIGGSPMGSLPFASESRDVARFSTGTTAVGAAPRAAGPVSVRLSGQSCDSSACCGPFDAVVTSLTFTAPAAGLLTRIEQDIDGVYQPVAWVEGGAAFGWSACFGGYSQQSDFYGTGSFRIRYEGSSPALGAASEPFVVTGCDGQDSEPVDESPAAESESSRSEPEGCGAGGFGALTWLGVLAVSLIRSGSRARGVR